MSHDHREAIAEVLADHMRGVWSDHTYSCQGCRNRFEDAEQAKFDAMDREPTRDELVASRNAFSEVSHPRWSFADYNAHLADALLGSDVLAQIRAEARAEALREAAERVEAHTLIGLAAGRAEAWDEGWLAAEESWGHEEPNEVNPYRAEGSA